MKGAYRLGKIIILFLFIAFFYYLGHYNMQPLIFNMGIFGKYETYATFLYLSMFILGAISLGIYGMYSFISYNAQIIKQNMRIKSLEKKIKELQVYEKEYKEASKISKDQ